MCVCNDDDEKAIFYNVEIFLFVPTGRVTRIALYRLYAYFCCKEKPTLAFQGSLLRFFPSSPQNIMHLKLPQYVHDDECERNRNDKVVNARDTQNLHFTAK